MKIFYYCYGSAHSSVLAAALHTGMLSIDRLPSIQEIVNLPHYDKTENSEIGTPFFYGYDEMDNEVYIIGMGAGKEVVLNSIKSLLKDCGIPGTSYVFINTLSKVNWWTRIGGFLSRALGLVSLGRPLTVYGLKKTYFEFVKMVVKAKRDIKYFQS
ncbi:hypothetical protein BBF96_04745 [Anoxybacter fermentans]|uniref:DUF3189 domain-containing protein n=1 Tax=Anoxybacter fermentans TaxID=1323375 RepID=A0A3Q9HPU5_9FIRM|nr:DUF3189 family protein [Anoxybacter fermentans]AZR72760.1 hypothetical protein BBF96_04745 [Anoxybacter fermentans]